MALLGLTFWFGSSGLNPCNMLSKAYLSDLSTQCALSLTITLFQITLLFVKVGLRSCFELYNYQTIICLERQILTISKLKDLPDLYQTYYEIRSDVLIITGKDQVWSLSPHTVPTEHNLTAMVQPKPAKGCPMLACRSHASHSVFMLKWSQIC